MYIFFDRDIKADNALDLESGGPGTESRWQRYCSIIVCPLAMYTCL